jgi:trans-aconitate methyltransferase
MGQDRVVDPNLALLEQATLQALRPRGWRDRWHLLRSGGFTAVQVADRLTAANRCAVEAMAAAAPVVAGTGDAVARERAVVALVQSALDRLASGHRVHRRRARYTRELGQKGPRDLLVDVYAIGDHQPG